MPVGTIWSPRLIGVPEDNVTEANCNCSTCVQWIYKGLNDCVWDARGISSEVLGLASIITWMLVSIPQMIKNFRHIRGVEGISMLLILNWTLGDTANLVGGILTKQLPLQIYLAIYFVFADLVLFAQFLYYQCWWKKKHKDYEPIPNGPVPAPPPKLLLCLSGFVFLSYNIFSRLPRTNLDLSVIDLEYSPVIRHPAGRSLMTNNLRYHIHIFNNIEDEVGYAIGIVSSIFYIGSRTGQLYKNYKVKSTEGLSMLMFLLAVIGNLTYGLSILVRSLDGSYVLKHLPWLVGSLGVIALDASLLAQFKYYSSYYKDKKEEDPLEQEVQVTVEPDHIGIIN